MARIEQTKLPGLGMRYDFTTKEGLRVGVIHHPTGRRDVFVCTAEDPDTAALTLNLTDDEAHTLVDALGGSQVVESLEHMQQHIEGLAIDWLEVEPSSAYVGKTIGDARIRTRTGVSVVAVIRRTESYPAPDPGFRMEAEDTLVVVGTSQGIEGVSEILRSG